MTGHKIFCKFKKYNIQLYVIQPENNGRKCKAVQLRIAKLHQQLESFRTQMESSTVIIGTES